MATGLKVLYEFGPFQVDPDRQVLLRENQPVAITPKAFETLLILVRHSREVVSKDELMKAVWPDSFVEEANLSQNIFRIRKALGVAPGDERYIVTLPGRGYRFAAQVREVVLDGEDLIIDTRSLTQIVVEQTDLVPNGTPDKFPDASLDTLLSGPPRKSIWKYPLLIAAVVLVTTVAAGVYFFYSGSRRAHQAGLKFTQLTDFTDSATAPALSRDGRMLAFIRGSSGFLTADQIYVKVLPNGEAKRLTDDPRPKYNLAFSPDGSQIAYTVLEVPTFATYTVSVLGGDSHLFLRNAAGLTWLDERQLLFSEIRSGLHMGIVTGTITRGNFRELYFPLPERAMAHYSFASPDRRSALVAEMDETGAWVSCRLISLDGRSETRSIGPTGACKSAGWSSDGSWMYFTAAVEGQSHLWRQRFPNGQPEQVTFGPTEEEGVAVEQDGRSVITSMGVHESAIWIHDTDGDRSLSSEGEIVEDISTLPTPTGGLSPPSFSADGKTLYYLLRRHQPAGSGPELWRLIVESGKSEAVFPGVSMLAYDVSPDGKQAVYATAASAGKSQLWLAPIDRSSPAKRIGHSGDTSPHFGPRGQILFQFTEGNVNYMGQMNQDGSGRSRAVPYPISVVQGISPGRRWVMAVAPLPDGTSVRPMAIPIDGGPPRIMCDGPCTPTWSSNGKFLFISVEAPSRTSTGRSLAIPVGPGESLPRFPPRGIRPFADPSVVPGSRSVNRAGLVPGSDLSHFAYVNTTVHRNLYRISFP
ncbi:winged helix-turn-helix domain-containing protein [Tunturiibacter gelidiferens]|uniref:winged helix-turn-helix domain-containing protein n=1 Tax=Tunturiibacter gelidiferens TaxID=3069689 RepID=UPI003D9B4017